MHALTVTSLCFPAVRGSQHSALFDLYWRVVRVHSSLDLSCRFCAARSDSTRALQEHVLSEHLLLLTDTELYVEGIRELCELRERIQLDKMAVCKQQQRRQYKCLVCDHQADCYDDVKQHVVTEHTPVIDSRNHGLDVYIGNAAFNAYVTDGWIAFVPTKALFYCQLCKDAVVQFHAKSDIHQHIK